MMSETDVSGPQWQARSEHGSVGAVEASPVRDKAALVRGDVIHRPALEHELDEALARRLTLVIAGPGFGKSTLVGSWARRKPCAWYTATSGNASLANFARGLVDALRRSLPDFPSGAFTLVRHAVGEQDGQAEAIAGLVCQMLDDHLRADHVLVVDDSHELSASDQCVRLVEGLCRQAPARFHLVLCSRAEPPFPVERLRGRGEVLELDASRLAFSPAELDELLGSVLGRAEPELAGRLQEVTAGWPAAARLAVETLRISQPAERSDVLETLGRRAGPVFSYFAEEVLRREPAPVQDLLRRVAPFDRVTVELCEALGAVAPGPKLASLVRRGLFVQPQRGAVGWFTLHALIREVVCALWPLGEGELRTLRRRAASWFETEGRLEAALDLRAEAGDGRGLTRLLMRHGRDLMLAGEGERVLRAAAIVPARLRGDEIDELLGLAHLHRGELDRARECLQSVAGDASKLPAGADRWKRSAERVDAARLCGTDVCPAGRRPTLSRLRGTCARARDRMQRRPCARKRSRGPREARVARGRCGVGGSAFPLGVRRCPSRRRRFPARTCPPQPRNLARPTGEIGGGTARARSRDHRGGGRRLRISLTVRSR